MSLLARIETFGNRLPHPATLFVLGTIVVFIISEFALLANWSVESPVKGLVKANSLFRSDGIWWFLSHMVENFIRFPPLGIVLVGMLGIGLAERSGLLPSLLGFLIKKVSQKLLTPATVFLGIISSIALDAGYVVLPPLVAALYLAAGRSPVAGIAAVFAGVSAGFSANLIPTALDPLLGGFTQSAAQILDVNYLVNNTANLWFMMVSTLVLTLTGWLISAKWVEPGLGDLGMDADEGMPVLDANEVLQKKALLNAGIAMVVSGVLVLLAVFIPDAPLFGIGERFPRWVEATVPLLFILFFIPGVVYGYTVGTLKNNKDVARMLEETFSKLGPYIVLAFFAAQFIECFKYSGLGEMLAITGGNLLTQLAIPSSILMVSFVLMVFLANLFIGSASAKYAFLAPVFVPMFMQVNISPELTQAAYRVGDSISNVITPFNPYMIIIVILLQRYVKGSGLGTLVATMLPYSIGFALVWISLLLFWLFMGWPLGPGAPLFIAEAF